MSYSFKDITHILQAVVLQDNTDDLPIEELLFDSRKLSIPSVTLFIAVPGPVRSGWTYIDGLYQSGVRKFLVGKDAQLDDLTSYPEAGFLQVDDPVIAVQQLTEYHRLQFDYPVIGITGSNGKTIIKEWLNQLLHNRYNIIRSPKSYNSQIGVPLSVWQMNRFHQLGIFEAGISKKGEMHRLQNVIRPTIGILGYVGEAHAEGFDSLSEKIREKLLLFGEVNELVYCSDQSEVCNEIDDFLKKHPKIKPISWSRHHAADLRCLQIDKHGMITDLVCLFEDEQFAFSIPFTDEASIFNALTVCTLALQLGTTKSDLAREMNLLKPMAMRLELKPGINQCAIINDSYSADIDSLIIALDFLAQQDQHVSKTVILSDMQHPIGAEYNLYGKVAQILVARKIQKLIAVGSELTVCRQLFDGIPEVHFFDSTESLTDHLAQLHLQKEIILLKGARKFGFEQLSRQLEQKLHDTVLEIDLHALRSNLRLYRRMLQPGTKTMVMVKAFGYGSGSAEIASLLQREGTDMLAVAYADEGLELRRAGIRMPIMVMNVTPNSFDNLVRHQLEPEIYSPAVFNAFMAFLRERSITNYPVHIKIDTGMHRLGFLEEDLPFLENMLIQQDTVVVQSIFTHLVASEDARQDDFTRQQFQTFMSMTDRLKKIIKEPFKRHVCNSAAISRFPEFHLDMVRLGIGLYGAGEQPELQTVATLKTTIAQIKHLQPGDTVGYGRKGIMTKAGSVATVRIGYADGYSRSLSNGIGKMLIGNQFAPVIGNVCMDMTMLDVTGIEVAEGDEVVVFGKNPSVKQLAEWAGTIAYEILTNISQRVKRVYFEE